MQQQPLRQLLRNGERNAQMWSSNPSFQGEPQETALAKWYALPGPSAIRNVRGAPLRVVLFGRHLAEPGRIRSVKRVSLASAGARPGGAALSMHEPSLRAGRSPGCPRDFIRLALGTLTLARCSNLQVPGSNTTRSSSSRRMACWWPMPATCASSPQIRPSCNCSGSAWKSCAPAGSPTCSASRARIPGMLENCGSPTRARRCRCACGARTGARSTSRSPGTASNGDASRRGVHHPRRQPQAQDRSTAAREAAAPRPSRASRPAHRSAEPAVPRGSSAAGHRGGAGQGRHARRAVPRPGPLQAHQRLARTRDGRQAAEDRGAARAGNGSHPGRRGAHGRR